MKINKSYKYRIYPNKEQEELINKTFGSCRFIYNSVLDYKQECYKRGIDYSIFDGIKDITKIKKIEGFEWLKEVDSIALQQSLRNLKESYQNFFKYKKGFPKFKSKKDKQSYRTINQKNKIRIKENKIKIPKIGYIKFKDNREIKEEIKSVTISKTKTNKYFASILVEYKHKENLSKKVKNNKIFSADMSCKDFLVSEEMEFENQKFYSKNLRRLKIRQRRLSRKKKGSNNRNKQRLNVSKTYEKITNKRKGFQKNLSHKLIQSFDVFCFEDLNIQGMQKFNKGISKTVTLDFSWNEFLSFLEWKCKKHNKHFIKVDRYFPSSKQCSKCGKINKDLKLSNRIFKCKCGYEEDRDINASKNIKKEGINLLKQQGRISSVKNSTVLMTESNALNTGKSKKIYPLGDMSKVIRHSVQESTSFMS